MNAAQRIIHRARWPRWWRLGVVAAATMILCSCRGVPQQKSSPPSAAPASFDASHGAAPLASLPPSAWTGLQPLDPSQTWAPPGIVRPWPRDEYVRDGGDRRVTAHVHPNWQIDGLEMEDTIAHYDTLDGRTVVEPSNRVHIYAPRFGAVRQVSGVSAYDVKEGLVQYNVPTGANVQEEALAANTTLQQVQTERQINTKRARAQQRNNPGLQVAAAQQLMETVNRFKLHENLRVLRDGFYRQSDEPLLALHTDAAITWTHDKGVQIILDDQQAVVATGDARAQATYEVHPTGKARLRIVKVASTDAAIPGTIVEFTLRFDNVGSETIGNVTIVDNLTTRLEYLPDSQQCTLGADFMTQPNDGDSLVLRWEIVDPLPAGQGGTIQFRCRLR